MATRFDTIVDALILDYQTETGDTTTAMRRGRKALAEHDSATRVVFVRDGGKVEPAQRLGPQIVNGLSVKPIRSRVESVSIHIFTAGGADADADNEAAETILDALLGSLDTVLETALVGEPEYAWFTETESGAAWESYGVKVVLACTWRIGVTRGGLQRVYPRLFGLTASLGMGDYANSEFSSDFRRAGGEAA